MAEFKPVVDPSKSRALGIEGRYYDVERDFVLAPAQSGEVGFRRL